MMFRCDHYPHPVMACEHGCHDNIDFTPDPEVWDNVDGEYEDGLSIITLRRCPICNEGFPESGEDGIIPHLFGTHPDEWPITLLKKGYGNGSNVG